MTFDEFFGQVIAEFNKGPVRQDSEGNNRNEDDLRWGQFSFNKTHAARPDITEQVTQENDPFYSDKKAPAFWNFVEEKWDQDRG